MAKDHDNHEDGVSRRHALECMLWAGTGVLWTVAGGVPKSLSLLSPAEAATAASSFTFLQISDSHVGFDKAANPNALGTLQEAIAKVKALPSKPAFMLHTGDITHLSKPKQFDDADQVIGSAGLSVFASSYGLAKTQDSEVPVFDTMAVGLKFAELRARFDS